MPARWRELRVLHLGELEVGELREGWVVARRGAGARAAAVEFPEPESEDDDVRQPDDRRGEDQLASGQRLVLREQRLEQADQVVGVGDGDGGDHEHHQAALPAGHRTVPMRDEHHQQSDQHGDEDDHQQRRHGAEVPGQQPVEAERDQHERGGRQGRLVARTGRWAREGAQAHAVTVPPCPAAACASWWAGGVHLRLRRPSGWAVAAFGRGGAVVAGLAPLRVAAGWWDAWGLDRLAA